MTLEGRRQRFAVSAAVALALSLALVFVVSCGGGEEKMPVSSEEAVTIAIERVEADGVMSLEGRDTVVEDEGSEWHVYFPLQDPDVRGGEPHVFVSKEDGTITEVFYTQ